MKVGRYTYGAEGINQVGDGAQIEIGSFCSLAGGLKIFVGLSHRSDWITTYPFGHIYQSVFPKFDGCGHPKSKGDVVIGNDVWIALNVTIMSGVHIGDGVTIAANSHVVKDAAPYTMIGGNPARLIRPRFEQAIIDRLLQIKWWDWDEAIINEASPILCSGDVQAFFAFAEKRRS